MLQQVLTEIRASQGTIRLDELSRKLGVERGALEGMISFLVRKGHLRDEEEHDEALLCEVGSICSSGGSCPGPQECPFVMKMPRTYSLNIKVDGEE